ncbi:MAG: sugar phosphate isomerase/epimerase [Armatimonadetes bacterium]|nr:sugar phosphate isomerase/epimerase [Armatimonadota bacterium]
MSNTASRLQLGIALSCVDLGMLERKAARAQAAGYHRCQVSFRWEATPGEAWAAEDVCKRRGLEVVAFGAYINLLRPDDEAFHGISIEGARNLIDGMRYAACRRIVVYSGTYGRLPSEAHPDNQTPEARRAATAEARDLAIRLRARGGYLCIEPHYAHVIRTPEDCTAFVSAVDPDVVRITFDPANLVPPEEIDRHSELLPPLVAALAPVLGLVHLKDIRRRPGGLDYPPPGRGEMDYARLMAAIRAQNLALPALIEHADEQSEAVMRAAREYLEQYL